ncbi:MAG TPA: hypothetical protein VGS21_07180 [Acidimicrobiales bacterium]|nr:hypothetical protein [Acidimicrobiales bacterium]
MDRPFADPPATLADLEGPTTGEIELPAAIDWGPPRTYDMASSVDRQIVYERVLREAPTTAAICQYVNGSALLASWHSLWLPTRIRDAWEDRLPELSHAT